MADLPYAAATASITLLTVGEAVPKVSTVLPLGGSHLAQLGIVLGCCLAAYELQKLRKVRRGRKKT